MPLDKSALLDFLRILDDEISKKITLVAVGGTAMTLLDLKPSTIDIDFTIPSKDKPEFDRALSRVPHGFKIDVWIDKLRILRILSSGNFVSSTFQQNLISSDKPILRLLQSNRRMRGQISLENIPA